MRFQAYPSRESAARQWYTLESCGWTWSGGQMGPEAVTLRRLTQSQSLDRKRRGLKEGLGRFPG